MGEIITLSNSNELNLYQSAFNMLTHSAEKAILEKGKFILILAGGNTPKKLYQLLKNYKTDWNKWILVYSDERCLPPHDQNRNSSMVENELIQFIDIPESNHIIISQSAEIYCGAIATFMPADFAILGIGEDGHTASLFPHNLEKDLPRHELAIDMKNATKAPSHRISLSYTALNQTKTVCFLAVGAEKKWAISQWQNNDQLPYNHVHGLEKTVLVTDNPL